ncbi:fungal-specific transcription factor domain-containing protein [Geopyxis carbonaria]|nr:fungal-specific transcription factor domain-containing protein [Geopyxis carbonaria]
MEPTNSDSGSDRADSASSNHSEITFSVPEFNQLAPVASTLDGRAAGQQVPPAVFISPALPPPQFASLPSSLRFLIDYYDKAVCGSIVVFDGHNNPYRRHILPMAFENPALLEAIYALAQSHLQSRRKMGLLSETSTPLQRRSASPAPADLPFANELDQTFQAAAAAGMSSPASSAGRYRSITIHSSNSSAIKDDPDTALRFKNTSTQLLQLQLADPVLARTDSALATLLILLWYHICEKGIGNFKTHLAGVKKLMMLRKVGKETGQWGWMETVFVWMDNMCSSINNREAQLRGGYLDMIKESNAEWGLESLVGCDRDLFMRLAGLGRINMLSQMATAERGADSSPQTNDSSNGQDMADSESEPQPDENDGRADFWLAWNAMKADLYGWKPSTTFAATSSRHSGSEGHADRRRSPPVPAFARTPPPPTMHVKAQEAVEMNHWVHASNIYRYAAVLYLDRLAYPHLPSSHPIFQKTVLEVLDHVSCVPAGNLGSRLFWPLFVTGSECVVEAHRALISKRCVDMQKDTGLFNKVSGLDILERVWKAADSVPAKKMERHIGGRGLRWRNVIAEDEMEYLMI